MPTPLCAADFAGLCLRYAAEPPAGAVPATIEHTFEAGRMVDHYWAVPAAPLLARPDVQALGALCGAVFAQGKADAAWRVVLYGGAENGRAVFEMDPQEMDALLLANGQVLPGQPGFVPPAGAQKSD